MNKKETAQLQKLAAELYNLERHVFMVTIHNKETPKDMQVYNLITLSDKLANINAEPIQKLIVKELVRLNKMG